MRILWLHIADYGYKVATFMATFRNEVNGFHGYFRGYMVATFVFFDALKAPI